MSRIEGDELRQLYFYEVGGAMKKPVKRILFWTPRLLGILLVAFLALLSLDVFGMGGGF
jgi:hypothetical protein